MRDQTSQQVVLKGTEHALPVVSATERRLLAQWNNTAADYPRDRTLHSLFQDQARRTPQATAVACQDQTLSYAELDRRATTLAARLQAQGVGAETVVGLMAGRSLEMVVGLLGILKAGCAYLPLDGSYPEARLRWMVEDAGARVVVTGEGLAGLWGAEVALVSLDGLKAEEGSGLEEESVGPGALAYVIYTSGSTGQPKGVMVEHAQVVNYVWGIRERLGLTPGASYAMVQPLTFDSSVTMLYSALLTGGCLHVFSHDQATDAAALADYFTRHRIDALKITPSHLAALQAAAGPEARRLLPRRWLVLGGEVSHRAWAEELQAMAPDCAVFNHYGPTETTCGVLTYPVREMDQSDPSATLPIGRPLPNTQVYLLDEHGQRVPIGTPGELYLGGEGVARGYLHRPDLTAERFLADPFEESGGRLYRTGDRARFRRDGVVEFLGRLDDQVKVRGYRIEPGEVEAALGSHPGVQTCAVVVREDTTGQPQLVAYAVPTDVRPPTPGELRHFLSERLPPQMVPSAMVLLGALPRTPHGKLDRRALPEPDWTSEADERPFDPPQTSAERIVAEAWAEVLGLERTGRRDDFFALGGTSLHAIRIVARLRERLGVAVPVSTLLEVSTVAALARAVSQTNSVHSRMELPAQTDRQRAPLSLAQQRLWTLHQMQPESPFYNVVNGFRLRGALDPAALQRAFDALIERHDALRTRFRVAKHGPEHIVGSPRPAPLHFVDLSGVTPSEREEALEERMRAEVRQPFDLENDLMLRALLVRLSAEEHALLIVVHHIAVDGWATEVLLRELSALYESFAAGAPPALPEPAVRYADFGAWHRAWLQDGVLDEQQAYWQEKLRGPLPVLDIPGDRPRPSEPSYAGARRAKALPPELTEPLRRLSRQEDATLFMTLLAAYKTLLYAHTGRSGAAFSAAAAQTDMLVGTNAANRHWVGVEEVVGFFANLLALRINLSGNPSFRDVLARVRQAALDAYAHPDVPFDVLVEAVQPPRDPRYTPLVQTLFSLRAPLPMLEAEGLAATPLNVDNGSAKFDLVFDVIDDGARLHGSLEYNTDVFSEAAADRLLNAYQAVLETVVADPDVRLDAVGETLAELDHRQRSAEADVRRAANRDKLKRLGRKAVRPSTS